MSESASLQLSPQDEDLLSFRWHVNNGYARGKVDGTRIYLHQLIARRMGIEGTPDHVNRDRLDNRRINLRAATASENSANQIGRTSRRSRCKGVVIGRWGRCWAAQIGNGKDTKGLGTYESEEAAALAYDSAARFLFGEFARCNFAGTDAKSPAFLLAEALDARSTFGVAGISFSTREQRFKVYRLKPIGKSYSHIGTFKTLGEAKTAQIATR